MARRGRKFTLEAFLKDKTYEVREAAADALNKGADIVAQRAVSNLRTQGIVNRHNKLYSSVGIKKATPERPRCLIKSEVYAPLPRGERKARQAYENWKNGNNGVYTFNGKTYKKKRQRWRNITGKRFKYPAEGAPYGRIIEFSPIINKPWFYKAWYEKMDTVKEMIRDRVSRAWSKRPAYSMAQGKVIMR